MIKAASVVLFATAALAQQTVWGQCGGNGWTGVTTCVAGTTCVKQNDWYSQCQPGGSAPTTTARPVSSSRPTTTVVPPPPASSSRPPTVSSSVPTPPSGTCPNVAPTIVSYSNAKLPDPFQPISGSRITTKAQWACRQKEISALFQGMESGTKPGKPATVSATYSGTSLVITASDAGKSISFTVGVRMPTGTGPFPAIIAYGGLSIPAPAGVAILTFNNDDMAAQQDTSSRGKGKFYTLYGTGATASAMTAWAWGVSRIIDALEITPSINIDPKRVGVTGCSRNGKGAFFAGAFDERIALTIPQESGSGGSACWRLSDYQRTQGQNVQTASEIIGENVWFSKQFETYANSVNRLPIDHHMLAGLVAPRGLFVIENTSMEWLGATSTYGCMKAAQKIYQALGQTSQFGFSQVGNHNHCAFPSSQQADLDAFVNKFLKGQSTNTNIFRTDGTFNYPEAQFVDWTVPTLS